MVSKASLEELLKGSHKWERKNGCWWNKDSDKAICFWHDKMTVIENDKGETVVYDAEYLNGKNLSASPWGFYVHSDLKGWEVFDL